MKRHGKESRSLLFRMIVLPMILLCTIIRTPQMQFAAVAAVLVWIMVLSYGSFQKWRQTSRQNQVREATKKELPIHPETQGPLPTTGEGELALIRQINYRVTEQMKQAYPLVSWLWVKRPTVREVSNGGIWRIRLANADPFNFGEVDISETGRMRITLLQAVPLSEAGAIETVNDDLEPEEILDETDCKTWYQAGGQEKLAELIDELNTQGHKRLLIKEDGNVCIKSAGEEVQVDTVEKFPPRMIWEEFITLFAEDEIDAAIVPDGLSLKW